MTTVDGTFSLSEPFGGDIDEASHLSNSVRVSVCESEGSMLSAEKQWETWFDFGTPQNFLQDRMEQREYQGSRANDVFKAEERAEETPRVEFQVCRIQKSISD